MNDLSDCESWVTCMEWQSMLFITTCTSWFKRRQESSCCTHHKRAFYKYKQAVIKSLIFMYECLILYQLNCTAINSLMPNEDYHKSDQIANVYAFCGFKNPYITLCFVSTQIKDTLRQMFHTVLLHLQNINVISVGRFCCRLFESQKSVPRDAIVRVTYGDDLSRAAISLWSAVSLVNWLIALLITLRWVNSWHVPQNVVKCLNYYNVGSKVNLYLVRQT